MDKRSGCIPKPTKIASHYLTLRRAKINGITAYIYYLWNSLGDKEKERYKNLDRGKRMSGLNIFLKEYFANWGFGKSGFGIIKFGSCHQAPVFYGFSTVAFGAVQYAVYRSTSEGDPVSTGRIALITDTNLDDTGLTAEGSEPTENTALDHEGESGDYNFITL